MKSDTTSSRREPLQKKKKVSPLGWVILGLLVLCLLFGGWYVHRVLKRPETMFAAVEATPLPEETVLAPAFPIVTAPSKSLYEATPSAAPEESAPATAAPTPAEATASPTPAPENRLNIMLMGIDAYESGRTTSGTMPHTDVMMVIAINFDADTVDLITLPRDTMTTAPGHYGIYKLNGVFNVGLGGKFKTTGKADDLAAGFELTCRAGEQWLGGISIPYYYALDFQAVIDIVDAIGGIDYDVDQWFQSMSGNRSYGKGMRHLDGDAVMGYLRIRRQADGLDSSRTARQRRMMVAIFKKLKEEGKLSQIPSLITAANSGIYTNTTLAQTASLANYAKNLPAENIRTWSMFGEIGTIEYEWRYVYVDQQNRIDLIREIFGLEAEPVGLCTRQYERWLHNVGFSAMKYQRQLEKLLLDVQQRKNAGESFTEEQIALYGQCYAAYTALKEGLEKSSQTLADIYVTTPWREKKTDKAKASWTDAQKARDKELSAQEAQLQQDLKDRMAQAKAAATQLAESIRYRALSWGIHSSWFNDPDINEIIVNFG